MQLNLEEPLLTGYQRQIIESPARFTVTQAATKCGKTYSHLWWLYSRACQGQAGYNYWWIAPVYAQAEIAFNRLRLAMRHLEGHTVNLSKLTIKLTNEAVIHFKSAEKPDNLYGDDVQAAVADEFTRMRHDAWIALRSTLTQTQGPCKFIGNVNGKNNWGYKLAMRAKNGEPGYAFFKITAYDAIDAGILTADEVEQARRDLPEHAFNELYLAEAAEDGSNPFGYEHIRRCIAPASIEQPVYFGVDLAKYRDWTVIIGLDLSGQLAYFQRFQKPWGETKAAVISAVGRLPAIIDSTGVGDPIVEEVVRYCPVAQGINYAAGFRTKQQLMEGLALDIQQNTVRFPDNIIVEELQQFEYEYNPAGYIKYSAPPGFTDDCVNALALACHCRRTKKHFNRIPAFTT